MSTTIFILTNETDYLPVQPLLIETPAVYKFTVSFPQLDHKTIIISQRDEILGSPFNLFILAGPGEPLCAHFKKGSADPP